MPDNGSDLEFFSHLLPQQGPSPPRLWSFGWPPHCSQATPPPPFGVLTHTLQHSTAQTFQILKFCPQRCTTNILGLVMQCLVLRLRTNHWTAWCYKSHPGQSSAGVLANYETAIRLILVAKRLLLNCCHVAMLPLTKLEWVTRSFSTGSIYSLGSQTSTEHRSPSLDSLPRLPTQDASFNLLPTTTMIRSCRVDCSCWQLATLLAELGRHSPVVGW